MNTIKPKLKICGITRLEDACFVAEAGADAIGFVFAKSPRQVTADAALKLGQIAREVNSKIELWGVFVDEEISRVQEIAEVVGLDACQLHGAESIEYAKELKENTGARVVKAFRIKDEASTQDIMRYEKSGVISGILLDAYSKDAHGGTGLKFNWAVTKNLGVKNLILAGGLTPENIKEAITEAHPYMLDVSSGVEDSPGIKSHKKINELLRALLRD